MNPRTDEPPYQSDLVKALEGHRGLGNYHETISFLTQWKMIRELLAKPLIYNQIHKKTRIHRNELRKILDLFVKTECLFKHTLAKGILEKQRGTPEYYILNFDHPQIHDILLGRIPNYVRLEYQKAKKTTASVREMKKYWPILNGCIDYFTFIFLSQDSKLYKNEVDVEDESSYKEPQFSEKTRIFYDLYQDERIQENLKQLKELEDSIFSIQLDEKRWKYEKYKKMEKSFLHIASFLMEQKGLTMWDAFIMCSLSDKESKESFSEYGKYSRIIIRTIFPQQNESNCYYRDSPLSTTFLDPLIRCYLSRCIIETL
ncbi:hypothetical protein BH23THE1_BH23THE1_18000 [soil metagenome]